MCSIADSDCPKGLVAKYGREGAPQSCTYSFISTTKRCHDSSILERLQAFSSFRRLGRCTRNV